MLIQATTKLDKEINVQVHLSDILDSIQEMKCAQKWNVLAQLLNNVSIDDREQLTTHQLKLIRDWLEKQLRKMEIKTAAEELLAKFEAATTPIQFNSLSPSTMEEWNKNHPDSWVKKVIEINPEETAISWIEPCQWGKHLGFKFYFRDLRDNGTVWYFAPGDQFEKDLV